MANLVIGRGEYRFRFAIPPDEATGYGSRQSLPGLSDFVDSS